MALTQRNSFSLSVMQNCGRHTSPDTAGPPPPADSSADAARCPSCGISERTRAAKRGVGATNKRTRVHARQHKPDAGVEQQQHSTAQTKKIEYVRVPNARTPGIDMMFNQPKASSTAAAAALLVVVGGHVRLPLHRRQHHSRRVHADVTHRSPSGCH